MAAEGGRLHILEVQRLIRTMPKVVVAVVPGWAAGGGHSLHVVCDLTIASREHARFKQTDADVGSFDAGYGSAYLARMVGQKRAREIFFLGRTYDAQAMADMGAVNLVADHADLERTALEVAAEINGKSPTAQRMLKFAFNLVDDGLMGQQVFAGEATRLAYMTDEAVEGRDAFLEKRAAGLVALPALLLTLSDRRRPQPVSGQGTSTDIRKPGFPCASRWRSASRTNGRPARRQPEVALRLEPEDQARIARPPTEPRRSGLAIAPGSSGAPLAAPHRRWALVASIQRARCSASTGPASRAAQTSSATSHRRSPAAPTHPAGQQLGHESATAGSVARPHDAVMAWPEVTSEPPWRTSSWLRSARGAVERQGRDVGLARASARSAARRPRTGAR